MFSLQFVGVFRSLPEETKHELALLLNIEEPSESVSLDQSINLFKALMKDLLHLNMNTNLLDACWNVQVSSC